MVSLEPADGREHHQRSGDYRAHRRAASDGGEVARSAAHRVRAQPRSRQLHRHQPRARARVRGAGQSRRRDSRVGAKSTSIRTISAESLAPMLGLVRDLRRRPAGQSACGASVWRCPAHWSRPTSASSAPRRSRAGAICRCSMSCASDPSAGLLSASTASQRRSARRCLASHASLDNFFYMHFGVGLGGTLVVNRSAYRGANGNATEIGHIPIVPGGKACYCGNVGLSRALPVAAFAGRSPGCELTRRTATALIVAQLERNSDPALQAWCREAADRLRDAVCVIENMLDPLTIVIGGSAPKLLVERLVALAQPLHHSVRGGVAAPNGPASCCPSARRTARFWVPRCCRSMTCSRRA